jgi:hypothetical protein
MIWEEYRRFLKQVIKKINIKTLSKMTEQKIKIATGESSLSATISSSFRDLDIKSPAFKDRLIEVKKGVSAINRNTIVNFRGLAGKKYK